ncbi:MAG: response regulator transcription factor [Ktedonobacteraceae bacterium]|nr:response regulator transcription factor [Ktedonobacteraceae bacterium]
MNRIRVLIVDDQTLVREGFRKLLEMEPEFEVVGTARNGEAALSSMEQLHAQQQPPDVVLMDIRMPHMDGIAATRAIKERWSEACIVILTTFDDIELIHSGLRAGALGYLLKDVTSEQLAVTIRMAAQGQMLLQPEIASKAFAPPSPGSAAAGAPVSLEGSRASSGSAMGMEQLTEREHEILALVASGASNRQIAENLFLAEGTVKNHLSSIFGKLGVRDRTQAALKAKELGLV